MKLLEEIKKVLLLAIRKIRGEYLKTKLKNKEFTIVSNNCWGGFVYQKFNLKYNTPFVGLFLFAPDYINLLKNFEDIIHNELIFINAYDSRYKENLIENGTLNKYPIGKLSDNIEIHFLHYNSIEEARNKWNSRVKRINMDNLLVKFSDRDLCSEKLILEFEKLEFKNKLCFTAKEYKNTSAIAFKEFYGKECIEEEWKYYENYVNIIDVLNSLKKDSINLNKELVLNN